MPEEPYIHERVDVSAMQTIADEIYPLTISANLQ
jgi:hypothetical protein